MPASWPLIRAGTAGLPFWATVAGTLAFVGLTLIGVRRALRRLEAAYCRQGELTRGMLAVVFLIVLASAWTTETLGIHALFGAFLAGAVMPRERGLVQALEGKLTDLVMVLYVPLYFAYSGLRASVRLVGGSGEWLAFGLIMAAAVGGKFGGSAVAARATGLPWREAGALGILMNTRGLIELVALNVGLDLGAISSTLFSMLVLMALATTLMTTPLLEWLYLSRQPDLQRAPQLEDAPT